MIEQRYIDRYRELWIHRDDIHAVQTAKGSYYLRHQPVTDELIARHLDGNVTCGWYALDTNNTCRWAAVDSDQPNGLADLQRLHDQLQDHGLPSYIEDSARGGHLWVFSDPIAARPLRCLLIAAVEDARIPPVEVFPKQATVDHGAGRVGSVLRGPLGVHRKVMRAFGFLYPGTLKSVGPREAQLEYAIQFRPATAEQIAVALASVLEARKAIASAMRRNDNQLRHRQGVDKLPDLYQLVSRFVELDDRGMGHCPFHPPDRTPSFMVNREGGYWIDFHEVNTATGKYAGGDLIEFYRRLKGLTRQEAKQELESYPETRRR